MTVKQKIAVVAASVAAAALVATVVLAFWSPTHTIGGEKVPTDPKEVCQMLADDDFDATSGEDEPFTEAEYKDFRAWAKDIDDEQLSKSFLAIGSYFKPGSDMLEGGDLGQAFALLAVYQDLESACEDHEVRLPNIWDADSGNEDVGNGWEVNGEVPIDEAPDTERWLTNWCDVKVGDTYDQVVEKMGEPTSDQRTGDGDPQIGYDYSAYGFTIFFDTDDKVNSFWAGYDGLGETDMAKLPCVVETDYDMMEREDMLS